ncbi:phosphate metabolism protein 7 [Mycoemilia scoparia]|uniref:Phosphate metabolism protein 7 n=1 Tax=Mycoemilia scoparia TaxID=417184 RepID=A0A9W7ZVS1_9FUNG|nr:phosphate metabolism protein 7 [Mycoemilia scoparia]
MIKLFSREVKGKELTTDKIKKLMPTHRTGFLGLFGKKVESVDYYSSKISKLNKELLDAKESYDEQEFDNAAFIVFNKQIAAHMAASSKFELPKSTSTTAKDSNSGSSSGTGLLKKLSPVKPLQPRFVDIEPQSIIWANLSIHAISRKIRRLLSLTITFATIIFWAIPVAAVASVAQLSTLEKLAPFNIITQWPKIITGVIQGVLPAIALAVLSMILIMLLRKLSKLEGTIRPEDIELSLINRIFFHQVFNVFIIVTLSGTVISSLSTFIKDPLNSVKEIAQKIPTVNVFFITYVLLLGLSGASGNIAQIAGVVLSKLLYRVFSWTPRKTLEQVQPKVFDYGTGIPAHSLVFLIGFIYSVVSPLMTIICAFYFGFFWLVYRYQFLYVYNDAELRKVGARSGHKYLSHRWVSLYFFLILMIIQMALSTSQSSTASSILRVVFVGICMGLVVVSHMWMRYRVYPKFELLPMNDDKAANEPSPYVANVESGITTEEELVDEDGYYLVGGGMPSQAINKNKSDQKAQAIITIDEDNQEPKETSHQPPPINNASNSVPGIVRAPTFSFESLFSRSKIRNYLLVAPSKEPSYPITFVDLDTQKEHWAPFPSHISEYPPEINETETLIICNDSDGGGDDALKAAFRPPGFSDPAYTYVWVPNDPTKEQLVKPLFDEAQENLADRGQVFTECANISSSTKRVEVTTNHPPEHHN